VWLACILVAAAACADDSVAPRIPPPPPVLPASAALVSAAPNLLSGGAALRGPGMAYVSMPPGTDTAGVAVVIQNGSHPAIVNATMFGGGFDPVAIAAVEGDTLQIQVLHAAGPGAVGFGKVPRRSRPEVVRTAPPHRRTDVPLNSIIQVVFSEPMDSASLTGAITLSSGGSPVPGSTVIPANNGDILRANFAPSAPLAPLTTYVLQVSTAAHNRNGDSLSAPLQSDFTTGSLPPDTTAPVVTILSPVVGDTIPAGFLSIESVVTAGRAVQSLQWDVFDTTGSNITPFGASLFGDFSVLIGRTLRSNLDLGARLTPGNYILRETAYDMAEYAGSSAPIAVTVVAPDTQPRIVVRSFSVIEFQTPFSRPAGAWQYVPQLVVADAPGQSGLRIVGFEMLNLPGLPGPWGRLFSRAIPLITSGMDTQLFIGLYGDWDVVLSSQYGNQSTGGIATARLTYRDASGHFYATTVQGPIVPGPALPATYQGGCDYWREAFTYDDTGGTAYCGITLRQGTR
jgi:hypothetical protein